MIPIVWFLVFSVVWTSIISAGAFILSRGAIRAIFAHRLWQAAALLCVLPWALCLFSPFIAVPIDAKPLPDLLLFETGGPATIPDPHIDAAVAGGIPWRSALFWGLVAGWSFQLMRWAVAFARLQHLKSEATALSHPEADALAQAAGLSSTPALRLIPRGSPFVAGLSQPIIFMPRAVYESQAFRAVYMHECGHIARGDLIALPIERFIAIAFWFSPLMHLMGRQLDYWREAACDVDAAAALGDPVDYAKALSRTARMSASSCRAALPVSPFIPDRKRTLAMRLTRVLDKAPKTQRRVLSAVGLAAALALSPIALAQVAGGGEVVFSHPVLKGEAVRLTSPYGIRTDPFTKRPNWHNGADIKGTFGQPIFAPTDGVVTFSGRKSGYGLAVDMALSDGRQLRFAHLSEINVEKDDRIRVGQAIGEMGTTGPEGRFPAHLHFEVYLANGDVTDPLEVEGLKLYEGIDLDRARSFD